MTELETLKQAKMYMEKLANGINPIDGSLIPSEDVVNHVYLSRCFFHVADILRQLIENGSISIQNNQKKIPFSLPPERRDLFAFSAQPIPVSKLTGRINDLIVDDNMKKLSLQSIQDWLMANKLLENYAKEEGKTGKRPTALGQMIGISLEKRMGQSGIYYVVVYNLDAQHFILDHLDQIIENIQSRTANQGKPWLPEHEACLRDLYANGVSVKEIAIVLKRNSSAVSSHLKKLGLTE